MGQKHKKRFGRVIKIVIEKEGGWSNNNGVIIDPSEEIQFKPEKTAKILISKNPMKFNCASKNILSVREQQLFKGFAIFGTGEVEKNIKREKKNTWKREKNINYKKSKRDKT
ncbi:hypothetical protein BpHYR1_048610 [Brachionus plicatilis]|uniref:Uncharacterized protein n=1 Tax=Brachionus plicatilis TaxID=10195 RepID=A0A3M7PR23_BRAPC|nr:hypothetical protein BpHYR1_048610 [Brachionus plicatilis]